MRQHIFIPSMSIVRTLTTQYIHRPSDDTYVRIESGTHCRVIYFDDDDDCRPHYAINTFEGHRLEVAPWLIEPIENHGAHATSSEL